MNQEWDCDYTDSPNACLVSRFRSHLHGESSIPISASVTVSIAAETSGAVRVE